MATAITLNSSTMEGQLMELMTAFQVKERDTTSNPNNSNLVTATANFDNGTFTGNFNLQISATVGADGKPTVEAVEYLDVA